MIQKQTGFSDYLEKQYLLWQMDNGRASIRQFSRWLNINHALVTQWMNGNGKPGLGSMRKLAVKLGPEVYDIMDVAHPPKAINELEEIYHIISPNDYPTLELDFDRWLEQWLKSHGYKRLK
jgi:ribosomal protein S6